MEKTELKQLQEYVKKRFDKVGMDYKTFDEELDDKLSYWEQKRIYDEKLDILLPKVTRGTKGLSVEKQKEQEEMRIKQEQKIKERFEKELAKITKDSKELEKLYYTPNKYIEMVTKDYAKGLLLYGETSLGKSYRVKKVLKDLDVKDFVFISGHITPLKFYQKLYQAKDSLVIFDDVNILDNIIILNMIKASLNENSANVVEYHTSKQMDIPNSFVFNGRVIILLNDIPKKNEHLKAIESRLLKYHLKFSREEILKIIFEIAHKSKEIEGLTIEEKLEIANWLKENTTRATTNLNIRLYLQTIDFFKWDKENWKGLALEQIQNDSYKELVLQGITNTKWVEETGKSVRTLQRLKKKMEMSPNVA